MLRSAWSGGLGAEVCMVRWVMYLGLHGQVFFFLLRLHSQVVGLHGQVVGLHSQVVGLHGQVVFVLCA